MLKENLKDAGEIISNILQQPLAITGSTQTVSLIEAAKDYKKNSAFYSDLSHILLSFVEYPESTQNLLTELDLICVDLESKI